MKQFFRLFPLCLKATLVATLLSAPATALAGGGAAKKKPAGDHGAAKAPAKKAAHGEKASKGHGAEKASKGHGAKESGGHGEKKGGDEKSSGKEDAESADELSKPQQAQVVLVLDSSRSMQRTDPKNLRIQGAKLFVRFLNEGDKLAILSFDSDTRSVLEFTKVARTSIPAIDQAIDNIPAEGNFTDLESPIAAAAKLLEDAQNKDVASRSASNYIVLLSDGKMDPHPDTGTPEVVTEKLFGTDLPKLKSLQTKLYTFALGFEADGELLNRMATETGGKSWQATDVAEIPKRFSELFVILKESQALNQVGEEHGFEVSNDTKEITFYIPRDPAGGRIVLVDGRSREISLENLPANVKWYQGAKIELVTVREPVSGEWFVRGGARNVERPATSPSTNTEHHEDGQVAKDGHGEEHGAAHGEKHSEEHGKEHGEVHSEEHNAQPSEQHGDVDHAGAKHEPAHVEMFDDLSLQVAWSKQNRTAKEQSVVKAQLVNHNHAIHAAGIGEALFVTYRIVDEKGRTLGQGRLEDEHGVYRAEVSGGEKGKYRAIVNAISPTFSRSAQVPIEIVDEPVVLNMEGAKDFAEEREQFVVELKAKDLELKDLTVSLNVSKNKEKLDDVPFRASEANPARYELPFKLTGLDKGTYTVRATMSGTDLNGSEVRESSNEFEYTQAKSSEETFDDFGAAAEQRRTIGMLSIVSTLLVLGFVGFRGWRVLGRAASERVYVGKRGVSPELLAHIDSIKEKVSSETRAPDAADRELFGLVADVFETPKEAVPVASADTPSATEGVSPEGAVAAPEAASDTEAKPAESGDAARSPTQSEAPPS